MATNFYFNNFQSSMEQRLIEDLCIESIKIYGIDMMYCPRTIVSRDDVFQEDDLSEYNEHVPMEMYVKNVFGFGGDGDFLSKFNVTSLDTATFTVARRTFFDESIRSIAARERPLEGDLVYLPLTRKIYKITFVEHESIFYQLGSLQVWDLKCELFEYSNEKLNTGIEDIDRIQAEYSIQPGEPSNPLEPGIDTDPLAQNQEFEEIGDDIIDFSQIDPFSEGEF